MSDLQRLKQVASTIYKVVILPFLFCFTLYLLVDWPQSVYQPSVSAGDRRETTNKPVNHKMAWRSSGSSNAGLVANLATNGLIKDEKVRQAMLNVSFLHRRTTTTDYHQG